jgi:hypothetical protein
LLILGRLGDLPPSPPAEKASTRQDQARKASAGNGARDRRNNLHGNVIEIDTRVESTPGVDERQYGGGQTFYDPAFTHTMMRGLVAATLGQVTVLSLMKVTGILR